MSLPNSLTVLRAAFWCPWILFQEIPVISINANSFKNSQVAENLDLQSVCIYLCNLLTTWPLQWWSPSGHHIYIFLTYKMRIMIPPAPSSWWESRGRHACLAHSPCHEQFCFRNRLGTPFRSGHVGRCHLREHSVKKRAKSWPCHQRTVTGGWSLPLSGGIYETLPVTWVGRSAAVMYKRPEQGMPSDVKKVTECLLVFIRSCSLTHSDKRFSHIL